MRSTTGLFLGASALFSAACVNGDLSEDVFAAIDNNDDGLRTVNKEVRHLFTNEADIRSLIGSKDLGESGVGVQRGPRSRNAHGFP